MADCLDDAGYTEGEKIRADAVKQGALIRQAAAVLIAIDNAAQALKNYKQQRDIASRSMKIAEEVQKHAQNTYWPRELEFLAEFGTPEAIEAIETMGRRYGGRLAADVSRAFASKLKEARCGFSRYCTSANKKVAQDLLMARAQAVANARVLGRNIAFAEYQARTDTNYERRLQAVALGRGLMGQAAALYKSAGAGLASVGAELTRGLNSALEFFGYAGRNDPWNQRAVMENAARMSGVTATNMDFARAPYDPGGSQGGITVSDYMRNPAGSNVGALSSWDGLMSADSAAAGGSAINASNAVALGQTNAMSSWQDLQQERWNEADVGNRDLARTGSVTYNFTDSDGDRGSITVSMEDFALKYVDDKNEGDH